LRGLLASPASWRAPEGDASAPSPAGGLAKGVPPSLFSGSQWRPAAFPLAAVLHEHRECPLTDPSQHGSGMSV